MSLAVKKLYVISVLNDGGRRLSEDGGRRSTEVDGERKTVTEVKYDTMLSRRVRILTWRQEEIERIQTTELCGGKAR